eukprot:scaffold30197_cov67-Phaeocystis_antarctica.AAC.3
MTSPTFAAICCPPSVRMSVCIPMKAPRSPRHAPYRCTTLGGGLARLFPCEVGKPALRNAGSPQAEKSSNLGQSFTFANIVRTCEAQSPALLLSEKSHVVVPADSVSMSVSPLGLRSF